MSKETYSSLYTNPTRIGGPAPKDLIHAENIKSYTDIYEDATKEMLRRARAIDEIAQTRFELEYRLPDITYALRELYKCPDFRKYFVGYSSNSTPKWSKGMCARASACIYELYGMDQVWDVYSISLDDWPVSCVTFLRDKFQKVYFGTTGEHFYPKVIPYDLGMPISGLPSGRLTNEFIQIVKNKLDQR